MLTGDLLAGQRDSHGDDTGELALRNAGAIL